MKKEPVRWYAARYRTTIGKWTVEVFRSGSGGWWAKCWSVATGVFRETGGDGTQTLQQAKRLALQAARR